MAYDIGDVVDLRLKVKRRSDGALVNPTTLTLRVKDPGGVETTYTFPTTIEQDGGAGRFIKGVLVTPHADLTKSARWTYRWKGTGNDADGATQDLFFDVNPTAFQNP